MSKAAAGVGALPGVGRRPRGDQTQASETEDGSCSALINAALLSHESAPDACTWLSPGGPAKVTATCFHSCSLLAECS